MDCRSFNGVDDAFSVSPSDWYFLSGKAFGRENITHAAISI